MSELPMIQIRPTKGLGSPEFEGPLAIPRTGLFLNLAGYQSALQTGRLGYCLGSASAALDDGHFQLHFW